MGDSLIKATREVTPDFPANLVKDYIDTTNRLARLVMQFTENYQRNEVFEVSRQKAIRKAQRQDAWKLWAQRSIRWAVGGFFAVVVYSILVFVSEHWSFISIPVRDMIIAN